MNWYWPLTLAQNEQGPAPPSGPVAQPGAADQTTGTTAPQGQEGAPQKPPSLFDSGFFTMMMILIIVMWLVVFLPQRRERRRTSEMLGSLKKGDKVQTIGGILGTIMEVRDKEVILKVDESSNTRMRFAKDAVRAVLSEPAGNQKADEKS